MKSKVFYTAEEAARILRVCLATIRRMDRVGELRVLWAGKRKRYLLEDILKAAGLSGPELTKMKCQIELQQECDREEAA